MLVPVPQYHADHVWGTTLIGLPSEQRSILPARMQKYRQSPSASLAFAHTEMAEHAQEEQLKFH
jgi:hypothetical protein